MSEIEILTQFKKNLIQFLDELIAQFPEEGDLVIARIFLNDQIPIADVMNTFIRKLLPLESQVAERNENFFLENNLLFDTIDKNKVNHFKRMWRSDRLDSEDRVVIWKWYDSFIFLSKKYQSVKKN